MKCAITFITMGRKKRIIIPDTAYHISVRLNQHNRWFENEEICELYLATLKNEKEKNKFKLYSFCLMPTHPHLCLHTNDHYASIDQVIHGINGRFAKEFNNLMDGRGHVWRARYSSRPLDLKKDLLIVQKYIAENPVKADIVKHPLLFKYNSIRSLYTNEFGSILDPLPEAIRKKLIDLYGP